MKFPNSILLAFCSIMLMFNACSNGPTETSENAIYQCPMECEGDKTYTVEGSCPVCKMDLKLTSEETIVDDDADLDNSIFNLTSKWNTEEGETIQLTELNGSVLIVVMIYTTCKAACPRLVADMRNIREKVGDSSARYILVSIDPENDTPERLKAFAIENQMDGEEWTFLQGTVDDVREFSNVLAVKYKQISPIDFSHSNIISVFDENGVLKYQQEGLGVDNSVLVSEVKALLSE